MRRATVKIIYEGVDISADLAPFLTGFTYTDRAHGKQDDISITVQDRRKLWRNEWFPSKGSTIRAYIEVQDWTRPGDTCSLSCGRFSVDEVEFSWPPSEISIGGVAVSIDSALREQVKTRAWESTTLKGIAGQIAREAGLSLLYDSKINPKWGRVDQRQESDAALVERLCRDGALNCKVTDGRLVIFSGEDYERKPASAVISPDSAGLLSVRLQTKTGEVYRSASASYWDAKNQKLHAYSYAPKRAPRSGKVLKLNERYETKAQAEAAAKAALRNSNGREFTGGIELMGRPDVAAGQNIELSGFGGFDGKYAVEEARHSYSNSAGYKTSLSLRVALGADDDE